jgi:hypothetical protein
MVSQATNSTADAKVPRLTMLVRSTVAGALTTVGAEDMIVPLRVKNGLRSCNKKIGQTYKNIRVFERFD